MLVDKFRYHLPLHRQHQRLADCGIQVSRSSLTNWAGRAVDLLEPVAAAQAAHILEGSVVAMDETSIKAGRAAPGRMRNAYFWPVFGEDGEIAFHYAPSRAHRHVDEFLGNFRGTLLSDGYAAYEAYAKRQGIANAQCWAHCRRNFTDAEESDPAGVAKALSLIGAIYLHEKAIRRKKLEGPAKLAFRRERSAPAVDAFFDWCEAQRQRLDLLPSSPFAQALKYAAEREAGLRVFLEGPAVSVDTNHLERGLRPIPTGAAQLAVRVDGAGRPAHRRHPEPARHLQTAGRRRLRLPGRCPPARRPAPREAGRGTDAAGMENAVRGPAPAFRSRPHQGSATSISGGSPERPRMSAYEGLDVRRTHRRCSRRGKLLHLGRRWHSALDRAWERPEGSSLLQQLPSSRRACRPQSLWQGIDSALPISFVVVRYFGSASVIPVAPRLRRSRFRMNEA